MEAVDFRIASFGTQRIQRGTKFPRAAAATWGNAKTRSQISEFGAIEAGPVPIDATLYV